MAYAENLYCTLAAEETEATRDREERVERIEETRPVRGSGI